MLVSVCVGACTVEKMFIPRCYMHLIPRTNPPTHIHTQRHRSAKFYIVPKKKKVTPKTRRAEVWKKENETFPGKRQSL